MKMSTSILCKSPEVAARVERYAKKVHGGAEYPFVKRFFLEGQSVKCVYYNIGLDEYDPTEAFEQRLIGYRDALEEGGE